MFNYSLDLALTKSVTRISDTKDSNHPGEQWILDSRYSTNNCSIRSFRKQGVEEVYCRILEDVNENRPATIKLSAETGIIPLKKYEEGQYHLTKVVYRLP